MSVRVEETPFDPGAETNAFLSTSDGAGAAVTFTGLVRSDPARPVTNLTLECYVDLARDRIGALVDDAIIRFGLIRADVIHRYGTLAPGEAIVQVMTLSQHRKAAFDAAEFLMDHLKTDAPFWKKEATPDGTTWVAPRADDDAAMERWTNG